MHQRLMRGESEEYIQACFDQTVNHYSGMTLPKKIQVANDMVTTQLIPMLTTLKAMDDGDVPIHVTSSQARAEAGSRPFHQARAGPTQHLLWQSAPPTTRRYLCL